MMEYFSEFANKILTGATVPPPTPEQLEELRERASAISDDIGKAILEGAPTDIRREYLADLLYKNPDLSIQASSVVGLPRFIEDLYTTVLDKFGSKGGGNRTLQSELAAALSLGGKDPIRFKSYRWKDTTGTVKKIFNLLGGTSLIGELGALGGIELSESEKAQIKKSLLTDVVVASKVASILGVAVPFSIVLHDELQEISESRGGRITDDELESRTETIEKLISQFRLDPGDSKEFSGPARDRSLSGISRTSSAARRGCIPSRDGRSEKRAYNSGLFGLALSGGGIRSATFNLGILQAMAETKLLRQFDYLSTVSGGGYIGGWLSAWIRRSNVAVVESRLSPEHSPRPDVPEQSPISFLREYSNYLTPQTGVFSADTWAMISTWIRNTVLNQLILVLIFVAVMLIPYFAVSIYTWQPTDRARDTIASTHADLALVQNAGGNPASFFRRGITDANLGSRFIRWLTFREDYVRQTLPIDDCILQPLRRPIPRLTPTGITWWKLDLSDQAGLVLLLSAFVGWNVLFLWVCKVNMDSFTANSLGQPQAKEKLALTAHHWHMVLPILVIALSWSSLLWWASAYANASSITLAVVVAPIYALVLVSIQTFGEYYRSRLGDITFTGLERLAIVLAFLISTAAFVVAFRVGYASLVAPSEGYPLLIRAAVFTLVILLSCVAFSYSLTSMLTPQLARSRWQELKGRAISCLVLVLSSTGGALVGALLTVLVLRCFAYFHLQPWHAVAVGTPFGVYVFSLMLVGHIGLLGLQLPDDRREWWSRLGGWLLIYASAWLALFGVSIYAPWMLRSLDPKLRSLVNGGAIAAWIGSTLTGLLVGNSKSTGSVESGKTKSTSVRDIVAAISPYIFVIGIMVLIACGVHSSIVYLFGGDGQSYFDQLGLLPPVQAISLTFILIVVTTILAWRVDVNEFSMHHMYKNRLVRCYLGASRSPAERNPHPFTGFDSNDDFPLSTLRVKPQPPRNKAEERRKTPPFCGPLPIINTALNVVKGDRLEWQERKAISFAFTPIHSGYEYDGTTYDSDRASTAADGYRLTSLYGYPHEQGIKLGTAVAISGAAVSPNMGFHTSPPLAFLMTMFNVRLGWWLGNPRHNDTWQRSSPEIGLMYIVNELTSNTNDWNRYINLSDGGHFENLGIYELVRRRCLLIVSCDAEEDAGSTFGGLANAIRKVRVDFGVEIELRVKDVIPIDAHSSAHFAIGLIHYPGDLTGILLYIKASVSGDEPIDIQEYNKRAAEFPHQTTADQWFDESQFESYRKLGYHVFRNSILSSTFPPSTFARASEVSVSGDAHCGQ